jgi:hypothetical protein
MLRSSKPTPKAGPLAIAIIDFLQGLSPGWRWKGWKSAVICRINTHKEA